MPPTSPPPHSTLPPLWHGLVDDAATFPPGDAPLPAAVESWQQRRSQWYADLAGTFVVRDTDLSSDLAGIPLSVVCTTGAGAIEGVVGLTDRKGLDLAAVEVALRDVDDLAGNARRVEAAVRSSGLADGVLVVVEVPGPVSAGWLRAADEVAAADFRLKLRLGHTDHDLIPDSSTVAAWVDAALDREVPFKATAGLHRAVRHDPAGGGMHGFLNLLVATRALLDGSTVEEAAALLDERDAATLTGRELGLVRNWFTSFGSCSVDEPLDDLLTLDLLEAPR